MSKINRSKFKNRQTAQKESEKKIMAKKIFEWFIEEAWKFIVRNQIDDYFEDMFRQSMKSWIEKHLTIDEVRNEINDFGKWIRDKL